MISPGTGQYKKILQEILREEINPIFLNNSFMQSGNDFYKVEQDIVKFVDLEFFRFNSYVSFFYWFNFSLFIGDFKVEKKITHKLLLTKGTPVFNKRIGYFWDEENHMYQMTNTTNHHELAQRMKNDIVNHLIPFYEKLNNMGDVVKFLVNINRQLGTNHYSYIIGLALAKAGKKEESKKFLLESTVSQEIIQKTAQHYGINLDE